MTPVYGGSNTGMMKLLADTMLANNRKVIGVFTKLLPKVNSAVVFSYVWNLFSVTE
jgi:predicted Rossmann-fold nucleotide-binding protein